MKTQPCSALCMPPHPPSAHGEIFAATVAPTARGEEEAPDATTGAPEKSGLSR